MPRYPFLHLPDSCYRAQLTSPVCAQSVFWSFSPNPIMPGFLQPLKLQGTGPCSGMPCLWTPCKQASHPLFYQGTLLMLSGSPLQLVILVLLTCAVMYVCIYVCLSVSSCWQWNSGSRRWCLTCAAMPRALYGVLHTRCPRNLQSKRWRPDIFCLHHLPGE